MGSKTMTKGNNALAWQLLPSSEADIAQIRKKCRQMVLRKAALSAGVSAVPIPGLDIVTDLSFLKQTLNQINLEFGMSPAQIERLKPEMRIVAYEMLVGIGGALVGKIITREVIIHVLQKSGLKKLVQYSAKIVPVAGQVVSASISFATFRAVANQHIDACTTIATQMLVHQAT
jgi:hypothetical protein